MLKRFAEVLLGPWSGDAQAGPTDVVRHDLATCVVLIEAARADEDFSVAERAHIVELLRARFSLTQEEAKDLMEEAVALRGEHNDVFRFTRAINEQCPPGEKAAIVEDVWRILYSDGTLTGHEDYLAHKLGQLLNLDHGTVIAAKLAAKAT